MKISDFFFRGFSFIFVLRQNQQRTRKRKKNNLESAVAPYFFNRNLFRVLISHPSAFSEQRNIFIKKKKPWLRPRMVPRAFSFHWYLILMSWKSNGIRTSLMKRDLGPIGLESEYDRQSFPLKLPLDVFLLQGNLRLYLSGFFFTEFLRVLLGFTGFLTRLHCRIE